MAERHGCRGGDGLKALAQRHVLSHNMLPALRQVHSALAERLVFSRTSCAAVRTRPIVACLQGDNLHRKQMRLQGAAIQFASRTLLYFKLCQAVGQASLSAADCDTSALLCWLPWDSF